MISAGNIHLKNADTLEQYINTHYNLLPLEYDGWEEWVRTPEMEKAMQQILLENKLG